MTNTNGYVYTDCKIKNGFFNTEFLVKVNNSSVFVNKRNVIDYDRSPSGNMEVKGKIKSYPIKGKNDKVLVELRGEPATGGARVWVSKSNIHHQ